MITDELRSAMEAVLAADPDVAERDELDQMIADSRRVRAALDAFDVRCSRRGRELAGAGRAEAPESMFGRSGGCSTKQAKELSDRTDVGDALPQFEESLGGGEVSSGHLDALANARKRLDDAQRAEFDDNEEALLAAAVSERVDTFARRCRDLARRIVANSRHGSDADELDAQRKASKITRWVDKVTGMHVTQTELDPVRDAQLWSAIDANTAKLRSADGNACTPWGQLQINALLAAARGARAAAASVGDDAAEGAGDIGLVADVPEVTMLMDYRTLTQGMHDHTVCETEDGIPIPVSTARRLACDAKVIPVVLGDDGEVLDVGREQRTANRAQRRALRSMHRTCAHPDCTVGYSACRIHHIRWWWRDTGPTDIDNLLPLCEKHHHLVHEGGWELAMTPDRAVTWYRPDGTIWWTGPSIDRFPRTRGALVETARPHRH